MQSGQKYRKAHGYTVSNNCLCHTDTERPRCSHSMSKCLLDIFLTSPVYLRVNTDFFFPPDLCSLIRTLIPSPIPKPFSLLVFLVSVCITLHLIAQPQILRIILHSFFLTLYPHGNNYFCYFYPPDKSYTHPLPSISSTTTLI